MFTNQLSPTIRYYLSNSIIVQRALAISQHPLKWPHDSPAVKVEPAGKMPRVLVIDPTMPTPDRDAGSRHIWGMLKFLTEHGFSVSFLPANLSEREPYNSQLAAMGVTVITYPAIWSISRYLKHNQKHFNAIILSRYSVAHRYMHQIYLAKSPTQHLIFNTEDLQYLRMARQAITTDNNPLKRYSDIVMSQEHHLVETSDYTLVVSDTEKQILHKVLPQKNIIVVPLTSSKVGHIPSWETRHGLLFVGGFRHYPNVDGLQYFLRDVWPIIRQNAPTLNLQVIGSPTPHFKEISTDGVQFLGYVESMEPFLDSTRISIAPLRFGAGLKGKVLESLSYGVPVVGTSIAAEGFDPPEESGILITDTPTDMALSIIQLHNDRAYWTEKSEQCRQFVLKYFSHTINDDFLQAVNPKPNPF